MKTTVHNPHTFDMSNYYSGTTFVIGGRDFEREDKDAQKPAQKSPRKKTAEVDLSFLHALSKSVPSKRI